jgi:hypothetical protein
VAAGAKDPRGLFLSGGKRPELYVAMTTWTSVEAYYTDFIRIRKHLLAHLERIQFPREPTPGKFSIRSPSQVGHGDYMKQLAESAFTLSPCGECVMLLNAVT